MKVSDKKSTIQKVVGSALVALGLAPVAAQAQPNVTYQGPITITAGGTYTGNYRSTDSTVPAVTIATSSPVILQGCIIVGAGDLIQANGVPGDITVLNSQAYGTTPTQDDRYRGRFIAATKARNIRAENNYLEHTTGFTIYQFSGDGSANQTVRIMRNKVLDIDGRTRNGGIQLANFIGLNTVSNIGNIEIGWNQVINEPNLSSVEDNINFYNSGGTSSSPALVHDNYVQGAYPFPATASSFSGTGMTTDGDGTSATTVPAFVKAYNNQFISTCNAGMNIAAGHDIAYTNNRIVTSALLPDGSVLPSVYAGTAVFNGNQSPSSMFYNNVIQNNTIGYRSPGYSNPYTDRQDESNGACTTCTGTVHLPNPISLANEQSELTLWQQKLSQNNVTLGVGGLSTASTINTAPTVSLSAPSTGTVGAALTLTAAAADANGTISKVEFYNGATLLGQATAAPYTLAYTPTAAGTLSLTARATDNAGAATSSTAVSTTISAATATSTTTGPANATFYRAIDLGGSTGSTIDGRAWEATTASGFSTNASGWANQSASLSPATDATRASMIRSALFGTGPTLSLAVPNGTYAFYLYIWQNDTPVTVAIQAQGQTVNAGYTTGGAGSWARVGPYTASVTNGTLSVGTTGANVNLSGLEVWKMNSTTAATPPTVSLSAPSTGTVGAALNLTATAASASGTISKVEFYNGATLLGQATAAPYTLAYTPTAAGTLSLTARATDNAGAATSSAAVSATIGAAPTGTAAGPANATFYRALNLGGAASTIDGRAWEASSGASGFSTNATNWANQSASLSPATDATRASMIRSALFGTGPTLSLAVPNGTYAFYLYIWQNANPVTVSIQAEGQTVSTYTTGGAGTWARVGPFTASVTDGTLSVGTTGANVNLSGLEVWKMNTTASLSPGQGTPAPQSLGLATAWAPVAAPAPAQPRQPAPQPANGSALARQPLAAIRPKNVG